MLSWGVVCGWQTIRQTTASGEVTLHLQATRKTGHCPECLNIVGDDGGYSICHVRITTE
ncbi:hypothetical protein ABSI06_001522 [Salmonella enterica subsp. enterica]